MRKYKKNNKGFTLVELAIVIVIIGLLVGGVLQGQSLIQQAEKKRFITEIEQISTALVLFKDKYQAIPGDFPRASTFFDNTTCLAAFHVSYPPSVAFNGSLCNGNGNRLYHSAADAWPDDHLRLWIHLDLAKLLPSKDFDGGYTHYRKSAFKKNINYMAASGYEGIIGGGSFGGGTISTNTNFILVSKQTAGVSRTQAAFSPEYGYSIDTKLDDGLPNSGFIRGINGDSSTCASSGAYVLTSDNLACTFGVIYPSIN